MVGAENVLILRWRLLEQCFDERLHQLGAEAPQLLEADFSLPAEDGERLAE